MKNRNIRGWFHEQFGGIKEGFNAHSLVAAILRSMDREIGLRGAFGRRRKHVIDRTLPHNAARGPRPNSWWKQRRKTL